MLQTALTIIAVLACLGSFVALARHRDGWPATCALAMALAASAAVELCDLVAVLNPADLLVWKRWSLAAEGVVILGWTVFSVAYARRCTLQALPLRQWVFLFAALGTCVAAFVLPVATFFYSPDFAGERMLFLGNNAFMFYIALLVLLVLALINLEAVLANASREVRWRMKFELLGAGAFLAVLIFYYSQGLLYRSLNMNLMPLRSTALIMAAVMIAYSRIWRSRGVEAFVSHQMAYRSIVLFVVGIYLVGLGLLGQGMRYFGDSFQRSLLMAVGFLVGVGLVAVLISETAKRKIRVFLHKNFYRQKYDYRTQWLQFTDRLASARTGDDLLRSIVQGFCDTFGMGCGGLFLRGENGTVYQEAVLLEMESPSFRFAGDHLLLDWLLEKNWVVNFAEKPEISGEEGAYLLRHTVLFAVPVLHREHLEGFILLGRPLAQDESYLYEDYDLMKTLARQAASAILNLRLADELSLAREMEAVGRISAFVLHDLKNLVSTLALVVDNAREYIDNPEFQVDMLDSLDNTVARMKRLMSRLQKLEEKPVLHLEPIDLGDVVRTAVRLVGSERVHLVGESLPVPVRVDVDELQKVFLNLLLNALEASPNHEQVTVTIGGGDTAWVNVADRGCGMSEEFIRTRLFKPFITTKEKGLGIGLYQCRQVVEAHGGTIEVWSEPGKGAVFTVKFPKGG